EVWKREVQSERRQFLSALSWRSGRSLRSSSVSRSSTPSCAADQTGRISAGAALGAVKDAVHPLHESHGHEADDETDEDDHQRLEHRRELLDAALELAIEVEAGDLQLLVERSGLLTDLEHLLRRAGKQLGGGQWL